MDNIDDLNRLKRCGPPDDLKIRNPNRDLEQLQSQLKTKGMKQKSGEEEYIDTVGKCANCGVEFHIHKIKEKAKYAGPQFKDLYEQFLK
jgi:hypothetical protein